MNPDTIWIITILIFSVIIHELAHGYAALFQGDQTAKKAGRLTLNPIPHIDPVGSILLPAIFILTGSHFFLAWAKPVPYSPNNLKNKKWGEAIVALAGPLSNIILAILFILITKILFILNLNSQLSFQLISSAIFLNIFLAVLNLIPIPPLDGSKILYSILPQRFSSKTRRFMEKNYIFIFFIFIIFIYQTSILENITSKIFSFLISFS